MSVDHSHSHIEPDHGHHDHTHGTVDPTLATSERGIWALKCSFVGLTITAIFQVVAILRIRIGKEINSAALVTDGYHARVDGLTSLAVLFGAIGVWLGFPLADPIIGLLISLAILKIVWDSSKAVFSRLLDGIEPKIIDEIKHAARHVQQVHGVEEVRGRWLGHRLHAELNITVQSELSVKQAHTVALEVRHELLHRLPYLSNVTIHVDPRDVSGEEHHKIKEHSHSGLPSHSHK